MCRKKYDYEVVYTGRSKNCTNFFPTHVAVSIRVFIKPDSRACASFYFITENSTRAVHYLTKYNYEMLRRVPMFSPILILTLVPNQFVILRAFFMRILHFLRISRTRIFSDFCANEK